MAERVQRTLPVSPGRRNAGEGVFGFLGQDMAVDLGTANTLVYVRRHGIVLNEPSVVAINTLTGATLAVGNEAKRMIGRTPSHIQAVRPLKDGVIADFDVTEKMLRYFIQRVHKRRLLAKPRVVVCVPSGITGDELDESIINHIKKEYSLLLGERTAEAIKLSIASVYPMQEELLAEIPGRDLVSGLPKTIQITDGEVRTAIEEPVTAIIDSIKTTLDRTPPELAGDVMHRGIVLTGGGALLRGLDKRLIHETGMPVRIAESPLSSVAIGSGKCLEEFEVLQRVLVSPSRR